MPYIITTKTPNRDMWSAQFFDVERRAVATLEEAREVVWEVLPAGSAWAGRAFTGGTVGPLPDGTVIEVKRVDWPALSSLRGAEVFAKPATDWQRRVIDAFNARQS